MSYQEELQEPRERINRLNVEIIEKIRERVEVALRIGEIKKKYDKPVADKSREEAVLQQVKSLAKENSLDLAGMRRVFQEIIRLCVKAEETIE